MSIIYSVTIDEVKQHFLTKVDTVTSVRIPTKPGTKTQRGFAYVEVSNAIDYEVSDAITFNTIH